MQDYVLILTVAAILFFGGRILIKNARRNAIGEKGVKTTGRVVSVKRQTGFDRDRSRIDIRVCVEYRDPSTGTNRTVRHKFNPRTPNVPDSITGVGAGIVNVGSIMKRHAEAKEYASRLAAQGHSKDEIKDAVMARAVEQAKNSTGEVGGEEDAEGYILLKEHVPVDVYLHHDAADGDWIHIVFH